MESAAALAKELGKWNEVADFYTRASELYTLCGRAQPASDALAKGARALEDPVPEEAIQLYIEACAILEDDGKEQMAFDLYRDVTSAYIKLQKYTDAAAFLLRWGLQLISAMLPIASARHILVQFSYTCIFMTSSRQKNATTIAPRSILFWAMIMADVLVNFFLHTQKPEGDIEEIKRLAQSSAVSHLDHMVIRLARKLPTGDVSGLKTNVSKGQEEELDLT